MIVLEEVRTVLIAVAVAVIPGAPVDRVVAATLVEVQVQTVVAVQVGQANAAQAKSGTTALVAGNID